VSQPLGVIKALQLKAIGQDDGGGDHGTGQRTTPRLVDTRNGSNTPGVQLLLMKKRRAPGFSPEALLEILPETLVRHRAGCKNLPGSL
jgi:hypothetical protein